MELVIQMIEQNLITHVDDTTRGEYKIYTQLHSEFIVSARSAIKDRYINIFSCVGGISELDVMSIVHIFDDFIHEINLDVADVVSPNNPLFFETDKRYNTLFLEWLKNNVEDKVRAWCLLSSVFAHNSWYMRVNKRDVIDLLKEIAHNQVDPRDFKDYTLEQHSHFMSYAYSVGKNVKVSIISENYKRNSVIAQYFLGEISDYRKVKEDFYPIKQQNIVDVDNFASFVDVISQSDMDNTLFSHDILLSTENLVNYFLCKKYAIILNKEALDYMIKRFDEAGILPVDDIVDFAKRFLLSKNEYEEFMSAIEVIDGHHDYMNGQGDRYVDQVGKMREPYTHGGRKDVWSFYVLIASLYKEADTVDEFIALGESVKEYCDNSVYALINRDKGAWKGDFLSDERYIKAMLESLATKIPFSLTASMMGV